VKRICLFAVLLLLGGQLAVASSSTHPPPDQLALEPTSGTVKDGKLWVTIPSSTIYALQEAPEEVGFLLLRTCVEGRQIFMQIPRELVEDGEFSAAASIPIELQLENPSLKIPSFSSQEEFAVDLVTTLERRSHSPIECAPKEMCFWPGKLKLCDSIQVLAEEPVAAKPEPLPLPKPGPMWRPTNTITTMQCGGGGLYYSRASWRTTGGKCGTFYRHSRSFGMPTTTYIPGRMCGCGCCN
jgi:hypothetical protein